MMEDINKAINSIDFSISIESPYTNNKGILVPRVSQILQQTTSNEGLIYWANGLGFRRIKYKDELQRAADIGTKTHNAIDKFFTENIISDDISFQGFLKWFNKLSKNHKVKVINHEETLVGNYYGGTYDLLMEINDKLFLVDFKTGNKIYPKYFLQMSAYRSLLYELHNIVLEGCIILHLDKKQIKYSEYVLNFNIPDHYMFIEECTRCFSSLVYSYYNSLYIEDRYSEIF